MPGQHILGKLVAKPIRSINNPCIITACPPSRFSKFPPAGNVGPADFCLSGTLLQTSEPLDLGVEMGLGGHGGGGNFKVEFVRWFFGGNVSLKKSFRLCLTFGSAPKNFNFRRPCRPTNKQIGLELVISSCRSNMT